VDKGAERAWARDRAGARDRAFAGATGVAAAMRACREALDLTVRAAAEGASVPASYWSEVETGKRRVPGSEVLVRIAGVLGVASQELLRRGSMERGMAAGGEPMRNELARAERNRRLATQLAAQLATEIRAGGGAGGSARVARLLKEMTGAGGVGASAAERTVGSAMAGLLEVPLINKVVAGYPSEFTDLGYPARVADEYVKCPDLQDPDAFAARVVGDSMEPGYREGDVVVFSPLKEVRNGADCFVRFERNEETTFKGVYFEAGNGGGERIRLQPLNAAYPPRVVDREEVAGLYAAAWTMRAVG